MRRQLAGRYGDSISADARGGSRDDDAYYAVPIEISVALIETMRRQDEFLS
jgi:hypothetical protein